MRNKKTERVNMPEPCIRQILPNVMDFKRFWKETGPFKYALSSNGFPPILLEPEEWIFGNDLIGVLKELMQFDQKKMSFVQSPFNPQNKSILRPEGLSSWKVTHFPEEWNRLVCDAFVPEGHLTCQVMEQVRLSRKSQGSAAPLKKSNETQEVEMAFFRLLEREMEKMGYLLLKPSGKSDWASTHDYLSEWEEDERDAGLL